MRSSEWERPGGNGCLGIYLSLMQNRSLNLVKGNIFFIVVFKYCIFLFNSPRTSVKFYFSLQVVLYWSTYPNGQWYAFNIWVQVHTSAEEKMIHFLSKASTDISSVHNCLTIMSGKQIFHLYPDVLNNFMYQQNYSSK